MVADRTQSLQITGNGDVVEPYDGILSIGSGSPFAQAAARALMDVPGLDAATVARRAMSIAADSCVYSNSSFRMLRVDAEGTIFETEPGPLADLSDVFGAAGIAHKEPEGAGSGPLL